jgi:hypothetical protein
MRHGTMHANQADPLFQIAVCRLANRLLEQGHRLGAVAAFGEVYRVLRVARGEDGIFFRRLGPSSHSERCREGYG